MKKTSKEILRQNRERFSAQVIEKVWMDDITHYDAMILLMEEQELEPEFVAELITPELKKEIEKELKVIKLIKKPVE